MSFRFEAVDGEARAGVLRTPHGDVPTPFFMPVATKGVAKAIPWDRIWDMGYRAIISNALFLSYRPGTDIVRRMGGIQSFTGWKGAIVTDSGGFQGLNADLVKGFVEEGMRFRAPTSGQVSVVTPERVIEIQRDLGSDVMMPLDHCPPHGAPSGDVREATERTERWLERSVGELRGAGQQLFGLVQGGLDPVLRTMSAKRTAAMDVDGIAIGGLSLGETPEQTFRMSRAVVEAVPASMPRYIMGLGSPAEVIRAVASGIDMFDSAFPTRNARHGSLLTRTGRMNLGRAQYDGADGPIDPECGCTACTMHDVGYLNHLYRENEMTAFVLGTEHNLRFMRDLMEECRTAILEGSMGEVGGAFTAGAR
ncbi:MAG: tRNA guanosine(34) transglycosylase Tgt [Thermoplasmata archaeon]|nr:tRNA guanosine(34) transglycosylase Tgt [Thermoplasmata archaeon]